MAQGSRQIQTQAQQQIQTLSPQQILVVKLLELPAIELEDRVRAELLENPALEEGKDDTSGDEYSDTPDADSNAEDGGDTDYDSLSDYLNEDDIPDYKLQENNHSKGEQAEEIPFSDTTSFYETLKEQLGERNLTEHQRELAEYLIGSLDDDGLLRKSLDSISDELAIYAGIEATTGELEEALRIIQDFDPAGLGARNLQECLLIQIRRKIEQQHFTP
jgi:RNA polymerase sigma-54 factor